MGSIYTTASPDGKDQDCDGTVDEPEEIKAETGLKYYLFLTMDNKYNGNLGGRYGADEKCNTDSNKPSECTSNAWAFISTDYNDEVRDIPAIKGINTSSQWYWKKGTNEKIVANNWDDLLNGTIANPASSVGYDWPYWTGSQFNGWLASTCNKFTDSGSGFGQVGHHLFADSGWIDFGAGNCNEVRRIVCYCGVSP